MRAYLDATKCHQFAVFLFCVPQIRTEIAEIQKSIEKKNKLYKHLFVPVSTLHLTLMVMHLADKEQVDQ